MTLVQSSTICYMVIILRAITDTYQISPIYSAGPKNEKQHLLKTSFVEQDNIC